MLRHALRRPQALLSGRRLPARLNARLAKHARATRCAKNWPAATPTNLLPTRRCCDNSAQRSPHCGHVCWPQSMPARLAVLGGEREERELPLLPLEDARGKFEGRRARVRSPAGPPAAGIRPPPRRALAGPAAILDQAGLSRALHFTLDDGRFPLAPQAKPAGKVSTPA